MKRKIYNKLLEWKKESNGEYALLIDGARRVGKSYIVRQFAEKEYRSCVILDFNLVSKSIKDLFENDLDNLDRFFMYLSNYTGKTLYTRDTLIVFDEVQQYPKARAAIKYLVKDGRYDYIETGSLISIKKNVEGIVIPSEEEHIKMFPMDFEEFLWAMGEEMLMPFIKDCFERKRPLGQLMHRRAMDYFRLYMIVGGMPQAVEKYVETRDFAKVDKLKRRILELYRSDISKYAKGYDTKVKSIFEEIPSQLQKHEKKFRLSALKEGARARDYETAFFWLDDAMIINSCYNTTEPNVGLNLNKDTNTMKCYMADTGLLISHAFDTNEIVSEDLYRKILLDKLEMNSGMIVENIVAQMLRTAGHKLFFYSNSTMTDRDSRMEIDFLIAKGKITTRHNISPIEVKSSARYTLTSLRKCIAKYGSYLSTAYVIHPADLKEEDNIVYLPLYMCPLL
ncbi:MAG: AAA family ATPase [Prevotella sp.]|nr:AAA family ATPase [Prevotella sp.]